MNTNIERWFLSCYQSQHEAIRSVVLGDERIYGRMDDVIEISPISC